MAVVMRALVPGMTKELYEKMAGQVLEKLKSSPGFIAHAATPVPGGYEVTEFWDSQEQHDAWIKETIMPAAQGAGMAPPIITIVPGANIVTK